MSKVYLVESNSRTPEDAVRRVAAALWRAAALDEVFSDKDLAAIKLHVGEKITPTSLRPPLAAALVGHIAATGARPFLTDTAVLYKSRRDTGRGNIRVAHDHGFTLEAMGAPFLPADGLIGADEVEVEVNGKHYERVAIANAILQARSMLVLSHATGHLCTGLGAALKNLGMGCASKKGKLRQHHGQQPNIDGELCTACGDCAGWCPSDAITVAAAATIDPATCIGCGECIAACQHGAVTFGWGVTDVELQERVVDHAAAIVRGKPGRMGYVTVATGITKDCDCMGLDQPPLVEDIGILASRDPVAIDAAVLDLVHQRAGRTLESMSYPAIDAKAQLRYAVQMGLGSSDYELETLEI